MALRENILNTNSALRAYERVTTDSELVRILFALCQATLMAHTNKGLRKYLEEMEGGECDRARPCHIRIFFIENIAYL